MGPNRQYSEYCKHHFENGADIKREKLPLTLKYSVMATGSDRKQP